MPDGSVERKAPYQIDMNELKSAIAVLSGEFKDSEVNSFKKSYWYLSVALVVGGLSIIQAYIFIFSSALGSHDLGAVAIKLTIILSQMFICRQMFLMYRSYSQIGEMARQWLSVLSIFRGPILKCGDQEMAREVMVSLIMEYSRPKAFGFVQECPEPSSHIAMDTMVRLVKGGAHGQHP